MCRRCTPSLYPEVKSTLSDSPPGHHRFSQLPAVRAYLEFARFPFVVGREERGEYIVEFKDMRFSPGRETSPWFVYRVTLDAAGRAQTERWELSCDLSETCR